MKPSSSSECPACGVLRTPLRAQPKSGTLRFWRLPAQSTGESREEVVERVGWLLRIWPQEQSRVSAPGGVQFNAHVSHCRKGVDITLLNVGALGLRPTPVGEVQRLQCEKRTVGRQVNRGVEITQKESALAPVVCSAVWSGCAETPQKDVILQRQKGQALVAPRPPGPRSKLPGTSQRQPTTPPTRSGANRAIRGSLDVYSETYVQLAGESMSSSSGIAVSVSKSSRSWSPGSASRAGTCRQWCRALSMMPAKSHSCRAWKESGELRVPWRPSAAGERFGCRVYRLR